MNLNLQLIASAHCNRLPIWLIYALGLMYLHYQLMLDLYF